MLLFQKYIFSGHLDDGEKLFEVFHRHSIEIWGKILSWILLGIITPIIFTYFAHSLEFFYSWWWSIIWIALSIPWILYHFIDWYFDALLITNYSLMYVQWHGIFDRESSRIEYEDIKEVNIYTEGILQTVLDYGDIEILSISGGKTRLKNLPNPQNTEQNIRKYKTNFQKFQRFTDSEKMEKILTEMVSSHVWKYGLKNGFLPRR